MLAQVLAPKKISTTGSSIGLKQEGVAFYGQLKKNAGNAGHAREKREGEQGEKKRRGHATGKEQESEGG